MFKKEINNLKIQLSELEEKQKRHEVNKKSYKKMLKKIHNRINNMYCSEVYRSMNRNKSYFEGLRAVLDVFNEEDFHYLD